MAREESERATWNWLNALIVLSAIGAGIWWRATGEGVSAGLIIIAMLAVLGIGSCVFVTWRARRIFREHVRMNDSGSSITINTPQGEIKMGQRSRPAGRGDIGGVPPYPGSTPVEGGAELSFGNMGEIAGQQYETPDSVENVVAFYKGKFAPRLNVVENEGQYRLALADENTGVTTIDVHRDGGKTVIFIGHMGKK